MNRFKSLNNTHFKNSPPKENNRWKKQNTESKNNLNNSKINNNNLNNSKINNNNLNKVNNRWKKMANDDGGSRDGGFGGRRDDGFGGRRDDGFGGRRDGGFGGRRDGGFGGDGNRFKNRNYRKRIHKSNFSKEEFINRMKEERGATQKTTSIIEGGFIKTKQKNKKKEKKKRERNNEFFEQQPEKNDKLKSFVLNSYYEEEIANAEALEEEDTVGTTGHAEAIEEINNTELSRKKRITF